MRFLYGNPNYLSDVTEFVTQTIAINGKLIIPPKTFQRNKLFERNLAEDNVFLIDFEQNNQIIELQKDRELLLDKNTADEFRICSLDTKLQEMHFSLFFKHGYINDEIPEQKMALRFINPADTVLEIGGNVGRNSMIVASLLQNQENMVVLECDPQIARQLQDNRDANNMKFHIEASALSLRRLWQKGWDTTVSDEPVEDHTEVNIISLQQLNDKYKKTFNTLVLDCEGAFYYILQDFPDILTGVTKILMENDYHILEHKTFVDQILTKNGFQVVYVEAGGWGPCQPRFFETWMKP